VDSGLVYLVQTDTTVGFLSSCDKKLFTIKERSIHQKTLQVIDSFKTLKMNCRVPKNQKNFVRRSKLTTFIYPNTLSFRVVSTKYHHHRFIQKFQKLYSTSANITKQNFDEKFAKNSSDVVLYNNIGFNETKSSSIFKINNNSIKKIR